MGDYDGGYAGIKTHSDRTSVVTLLNHYDQMTSDQILIVNSNVTEFKDDVKILDENNLSVFHDP